MSFLIGTAEIFFAPDATTESVAAQTGYLSLGNCPECTAKTSQTETKRQRMVRGLVRTRDVIPTEKMVSYDFAMDEVSPNFFTFLYGTTDPTVSTQSAGSVTCQAITAAKAGRWYPLFNASGGARIGKVTSISVSGLTVGTDFESDLETGQIMFYADQSSRTPSCALAAMTVSKFPSMTKNRFRGIGRVVFFSAENPGSVLFEHVGFGCDLIVNADTKFDGKTISDLKLSMMVTNPDGDVLWRA